MGGILKFMTNIVSFNELYDVPIVTNRQKPLVIDFCHIFPIVLFNNSRVVLFPDRIDIYNCTRQFVDQFIETVIKIFWEKIDWENFWIRQSIWQQWIASTITGCTFGLLDS